MGRWSCGHDHRQDPRGDDGWRTVRRHGGGGGGRNGGGRKRDDDGGGYGGGGAAFNLRQECDRLRAQVAKADRQAEWARRLATDKTPHPGARENHREGDWMCIACAFKSNRHERAYCYRCAEPRHLSHAGSRPGAPPTPALASAQLGVGSGAAATAGPPGGAPEPVPQEDAKAIRARIEGLTNAKTSLAAVAGCQAQVAALDAEIDAARRALAALLPVEVAVKSTIAPAAQARVAVQRGEAKVAKLEGQITALFETYEAAVAELAEQKEKLAQAEAATARAATSALPRADVTALLASDPAAVWAALMSFVRERMPGLPQQVAAHMEASTKAFEQACSLLPAAAPSPAPAPAAAASAATADMSVAVAAGGACAVPAAAPVGPGPGLILDEQLIISQQQQAQQQHQHQHQHQQQQQQLQQQQLHLAEQQRQQVEAMVTAAAAATIDEERRQAAIAAATAATTATAASAGSASDPAAASAVAAAAASAENSVPGGADGLLNDGCDADLQEQPADVSMGGGASQGIVGKRTIAEAMGKVRQLAAKAKASKPA